MNHRIQEIYTFSHEEIREAIYGWLDAHGYPIPPLSTDLAVALTNNNCATVSFTRDCTE